MIFIAEIGMNYNNNFNLCAELIKQAKISGADIAKFQLGWRDGKDEINQLDEHKIKQLYDWGNYYQIKIMFSVIKDSSLDQLKKFNPNIIKVASRTFSENKNLVKKILELNIQTFISLGMVNDYENLEYNENISYLWCRSNYPTETKDLKNFPKKFDEKIKGYSDHCIGIETCLLAIARQAQVIEKHFTLDKSENIIRDHALSATPDEFRNLVNIGRDINKKILLGI